MEIASNKGVIADASTPAGRAGMSESEWREAIKFDSTDTGWVIMSIGMAIGAGIVFLPVQVGLMGLWVFLLSSCNFAFFSGLIGAQFWAERAQPKSPELDAKLLVSC